MSHVASPLSSAVLTADTIPAAQATIAAPEDAATDVPRDKQAAFVCTLAQWGNVQAAARQVGVSRAHLYRMRRASAQFRNLWDAALVLARPQVEEVLADRALNGVQETVFYHGEEVATRTRYDSRLLLAHLARLDRIAATSGVIATVRDFDAELERLIDPPAPDDWEDEGEDWEDGEWEDEAGEAYDDEGYEDEDAEYAGEGEDEGEGGADDEPATDVPAETASPDNAAHNGEASLGQRPEGEAPADEHPESRANPAASGGPARQPGEGFAAAQERVGAGWGGAFSRPVSWASGGAGFDVLDSVSCVSNSGGAGGSLGR